MIGENLPKFSDFLKTSFQEAEKAKLDIERGGGNDEDRLKIQAEYDLFKGFKEKSMLDNAAKCRKLDEAVKNRIVGEVPHIKYVVRILFYSRLLSASYAKEFKCLETYRRSQRVCALVYNSKLKDADLDKIAEVASSFFKVKDAGSKLIDHIENVKDLVSDAKLQEEVEKLVQSKFTSSPGLYSFQMAGHAKECFPLNIDDLFKRKNINMIELLEYHDANNHITEARLSKGGRLVISGMLQRLNEVHKRGWCVPKLTLDSFLVNEDYGVMLDVQNLRPAKEAKIFENFKSLKTVIEELLKSDKSKIPEASKIPKDVERFLHLMENLKNPGIEQEGSSAVMQKEIQVNKRINLVLNHSCLWSPMEMIKRVMGMGKLLFSYEEAVSDSGFGPGRKNWLVMIPKDSMYEKVLERSPRRFDLTGHLSGLPIYLRDAFTHANHYALRQERKTLEDMEKDFFVIFADCLMYLTEDASAVEPLELNLEIKMADLKQNGDVTISACDRKTCLLIDHTVLAIGTTTTTTNAASAPQPASGTIT